MVLSKGDIMEPPVFKLTTALDMAVRIRDELEKIRSVLTGPGHFDADTTAALMADLLHYINFVLQRGDGGQQGATGISRDSTLCIIEHGLDRLNSFVKGGTAYASAKGGSIAAPGVNRLFISVALDLEYLLAHDPLKDSASKIGRFRYEGPYLC
jgi:hypothetical protein